MLRKKFNLFKKMVQMNRSPNPRYFVASFTHNIVAMCFFFVLKQVPRCAYDFQMKVNKCLTVAAKLPAPCVSRLHHKPCSRDRLLHDGPTYLTGQHRLHLCYCTARVRSDSTFMRASKFSYNKSLILT